MNRQNRNELINTENKLTVSREEGVGDGLKVKGNERHKLPVIQQLSPRDGMHSVGNVVNNRSDCVR